MKEEFERWKRKIAAGFADNKSVFIMRWCNMNVGSMKTNAEQR